MTYLDQIDCFCCLQLRSLYESERSLTCTYSQLAFACLHLPWLDRLPVSRSLCGCYLDLWQRVTLLDDLPANPLFGLESRCVQTEVQLEVKPPVCLQSSKQLNPGVASWLDHGSRLPAPSWFWQVDLLPWPISFTSSRFLLLIHFLQQ